MTIHVCVAGTTGWQGRHFRAAFTKRLTWNFWLGYPEAGQAKPLVMCSVRLAILR